VASRRTGARFPVRARAKGGGQPNEIWTFQDDGSGGGYPWNFTFSPECAPAILLTANEDGPGPLTIQPPRGDTASPLQIGGNAVVSQPWEGGSQSEQWAMTFVPQQIP
jgi:hypothetical protein